MHCLFFLFAHVACGHAGPKIGFGAPILFVHTWKISYMLFIHIVLEEYTSLATT